MTARRSFAFVLFALIMAWYGRDGARVHAQTKPRPEQIRNIEQVRIACGTCDPRPGTLVLTTQISDGRTIQTPTDIKWADPADAGKPTVCVAVFIRVAIAPPPAWPPPLPVDWPPHNIRQNTCYTQLGVIGLLKDPAWLAWWLAHGGPPIVTGVPIGPLPNPVMDALIRDLLTHPRPIPVTPVQPQ